MSKETGNIDAQLYLADPKHCLLQDFDGLNYDKRTLDTQAGRKEIQTKEFNHILQDLNGRFRHVYGERLANTILFGSRARGDAGTDSDVDVLVALKGPVEPSREIERTGDDVADISLASGLVICCVFVSSDRLESEDSPLMINVRREGIPF